MRQSLIAGMVLGGLAFLPPTARAAAINDVTLIDGESVTFANGVYAGQSGLAGQIQLTTSTGAYIDAWCIDLYHDVYLGPQTPALQYTGLALQGASNGNGAFLTAMQAQEIAGLVAYGNQIVAGPDATADQVAGVQMAIWEIENPGLLFSAPTGAVAAELADIALAPTLYGDVESMVSLTGTQELAALTDQIPEPGSMSIMLGGLLALTFGYAKVRPKAQASAPVIR